MKHRNRVWADSFMFFIPLKFSKAAWSRGGAKLGFYSETCACDVKGWTSWETPGSYEIGSVCLYTKVNVLSLQNGKILRVI